MEEEQQSKIPQELSGQSKKRGKWKIMFLVILGVFLVAGAAWGAVAVVVSYKGVPELPGSDFIKPNPSDEVNTSTSNIQDLEFTRHVWKLQKATEGGEIIDFVGLNDPSIWEDRDCEMCDERAYTLEFNPNGKKNRYSVHGFINGGGGVYEIKKDEGEIKIVPGDITEIACSEGCDSERKFLDLLLVTQAYEISGESSEATLTLRGEESSITFISQSEKESGNAEEVNENPETLIESEVSIIAKPLSPLGVGTATSKRYLEDDRCMTASAAGTHNWGIYQASKEFLINKGYSQSYFAEHFCPIAIRDDNGYARVTYKVTFGPYLAGWQHAFPITGEGGNVSISTSGVYAVPQFKVQEINTFLSPKELQSAMEELIGPFDGLISVSMGASTGSTLGYGTVRLYANAQNKNQNSTSCSNTDRVGVIDVQTGESEIIFTGACQMSGR